MTWNARAFTSRLYLCVWRTGLLVFVSDTGGPASRRGITLLERLLDAPPLRLGRREDLGQIRLAHGGGNALVVLEAPEAAIVSAANRSGRPILGFAESLDTAVHDLRAVHGVGFVEALRHAMRLRACADGLHARQIEAQAVAICDVLGLPDALPSGEAVVPSMPRERLSALEGEILAAAGATPSVWPEALFLQGDAPGNAVDGAMDLVGPARLLAYGPYLHLAAGAWTLQAQCAVSGNHSGNRLALDMIADGVAIGGAAIDLPANGACELAFAFEIVEPRHALELYWRLVEGAIEGTLAIAGVRLVSDRA